MSSPLASLLLDNVRRRTGEAAEAWLDAVTRADDADAVCSAYTSAPRYVGRGPLALAADERRALAEAAPEVGFDRWTIDDAARAALLAAAAEQLSGDAFVALATECFERGDAREQQSWLRGIALLPGCDRFLPLAIDACRTNIIPLFESIACENPYPARSFPDRNFNQLVLKSLFNSIAIARIVGLQRRLNTELTRMAEDYAAERRAAGRSVPADISLAMAAGRMTEDLTR